MYTEIIKQGWRQLKLPQYGIHSFISFICGFLLCQTDSQFGKLWSTGSGCLIFSLCLTYLFIFWSLLVFIRQSIKKVVKKKTSCLVSFDLTHFFDKFTSSPNFLDSFMHESDSELEVEPKLSFILKRAKWIGACYFLLAAFILVLQVC